METQPILTTPKPTTKARNLLLAGLAVAAMGYYILFASTQDSLVRGFGWTFMVCALACIYGVFTLNSLSIYEDRFEMEFLWIVPKKIIQRKDILRWEEKEMRGQKRLKDRMAVRISYILILHTTTGKIRFPSLNYDEYDQIKAELTAGKVKV